MTEAQTKSGRPKSRKLLEKYRGYNFKLNNESYFTLVNTDQSDNYIFYSDNK